MTVSSTTRKAGPFAGNGVATVFPFAFKVFAKTDIKLLKVDQNGALTTLTLDSDYSVSLNTDQNNAPGGNITYPISGAPLPSGYSLIGLGSLQDLQPTDITNMGGFYPNVIEDMVDRAVILIQQLAEITGRALVVSEAENAAPPLPTAAARANTLLGFDTSGNAVAMPITTSVGAGDLKNETWTAGVDFTAGVSNSVTLSRAYTSKANLGSVVMQGIAQDPASYTLNGNQLTFNAVIPLGITRIWCVGGTTLSIATPAQSTVVDSSVASNTALYERIFGMVNVMDPQWGAKGDAVIDPTTGAYVSGTDDTLAIQRCLNANKYVRFPAGFKFYAASGLTVPNTVKGIEGLGAMMIGPGKFSTVDGFTFTNWYQGGTIIVTSEKFVLPSLSWFRYGVNLTNSAFLNIESDTITQCTVAYFMSVAVAVPTNYCFEMNLKSRFISKCQNATNTWGGAFYLQSTGSSTNAFQGCVMEAFSIDDVFAAVYQEFSSIGTNGNINNQFILTNVDQSRYAVYNTLPNCTSQNLYQIPQGMTSQGNPQMFYNCQPGTDMFELGGMSFSDPTFTGLSNFAYNGWGNRPSCTQFTSGVLTVYVSQTGSDTTGTGNSTAPFATIQKAVNVLQGLDLMGQTAFIALRDGTYTAGAAYAALGGANCSGSISLIGNQGTPANVVVNGNIVANGAGAHITVSGMTLANGGLLSQNDAMIDVGPGMIFAGNASGDHMQADMGGVININTAYSAFGSAVNHLHARRGGIIAVNATIAGTFTGSPAYTNVALAEGNGLLSMTGITYTGAGVSGTKYTAKNGGGIDTNGGGSNFFPGTVAGTATSPGWYA